MQYRSRRTATPDWTRGKDRVLNAPYWRTATPDWTRGKDRVLNAPYFVLQYINSIDNHIDQGRIIGTFVCT